MDLLIIALAISILAIVLAGFAYSQSTAIPMTTPTAPTNSASEDTMQMIEHAISPEPRAYTDDDGTMGAYP